MTPRVNLLPPEFHQRVVERRYAFRSAGGLVVLLLVLLLVTVMQGRQIGAAEARRDTAQAELAQLQEEQAELRPFDELAGSLESRNEVISFAMAREISWATTLTDLAATLPEDASLTSVSATMDVPPVPGGESQEQPAAGAAADQDVVATLSLDGYSVTGLAPGVASVLEEVETGPRFATPVLASADAGERGVTEVTNFQGTVPLAAGAYTNRYGEPGDGTAEAESGDGAAEAESGDDAAEDAAGEDGG